MSDEVSTTNAEDEVAREIEKALYAALQDEMNGSARSQQAAEFRVGVSDLGFCPERTRRMIDKQVPEDVDMLPAWIGTWLGSGLEAAAKRLWADAILQSEVEVTLVGPDSGNTYVLSGHPDIVLPGEAMVLDGKTDYGLTTVERTGPSLQQQYQRHLYGLGAWEAGMFGDIDIEEVRVGNVWLDRAGVERRLHANVEHFDWEVFHDAERWLDDVVYAWINGEQAEKVPPREMCAKVCGFYRVCRQYDTDVEGLLTDQVLVTAAEMYREGAELEKRGKQLRNEAKVHLAGVSGSTGSLQIRWTHINETDVPAFTRRGYDKLEVKEIKK